MSRLTRYSCRSENNRLHRRQRDNEERPQLDYTAFLLTVATGPLEPGPAAPAEGEVAGTSGGQPAAQLPPSDELTPEVTYRVA